MGLAAETSTISPEALSEAFTTLRGRAPLVQCPANIVVPNYTGNVLLAAERSTARGTFAVALLDSLAQLSPDDLRESVRLS